MLRRRHRDVPSRLLFALPLALGLVVVPLIGATAAASTTASAPAEVPAVPTARELVLPAERAPLAEPELDAIAAEPSAPATADAADAAAPSNPTAASNPSDAPLATAAAGAEPAASSAATGFSGGSAVVDPFSERIAASTEFQAEVVRLVNLERAKAGLSALAVDSRLTQASAVHSVDQAEHQSGGHVGSDGTRGGDRITAQGYTWCVWGENVAWGYETPKSVVDAWMASPTHKANILKSSFVHTGLATARGTDGRLYWTQVFAAPC